MSRDHINRLYERLAVTCEELGELEGAIDSRKREIGDLRYELDCKLKDIKRVKATLKRALQDAAESESFTND